MNLSIVLSEQTTLIKVAAPALSTIDTIGIYLLKIVSMTDNPVNTLPPNY